MVVSEGEKSVEILDAKKLRKQLQDAFTKALCLHRKTKFPSEL